jgi:hypothetical protein
MGLAEWNERAAEPIGQTPRHRAAANKKREVDVMKRPAEPEVPDRAANQPDGAADGLGDGHEQRAQRLETLERDRGGGRRISRARHAVS